jgi:DNA-binding SARP family transcriptional activator
VDVRDSALRFTVFGPVRARRDGVELDLGPPGQRALLAVLLAGGGDPVGVDEIVDVLWGDDPPASAVNVVHRNVGRLRRVFEPVLPPRATGAWLLPGGRAYRLAVDADTADLPAFRQGLDRARSALRSGNARRAIALFREALGSAAAPVAAGLEPRVREHPTFTALERERLDAVCEAADAGLADGDAAAVRTVVPALRRAAVEHEFDEPVHARLVLALAATGRQAEALACHSGVRRRLAAELGIDPGPELREAQQRVLRQQTAPGKASSGSSATTVPSIPPAQLPPATAAFTGRGDELAAALRMTSEPDASSRVVIGVIGGMAGIGKTALAVQWAHQVADRFPGGQLYVDLRGFDSAPHPITPAEAVRGFLEALGVAGPVVPADLDGRTALYRTLVAGRRVLVLLDNARDSEQVRALLPGSPGCLVIVTSRNPLTGLIAGHGARPVALHPLPAADAREFLIRRLGADRVDAEPVAVEAIVAACSGLPLAMSIVAARAATNPTFPLSAPAAQLRESAGGLDALAGEDPAADARSVFSWSYDALSPAAARLFRLLALYPGPEIALTAAANVAGLGLPESRRLLRELTAASLLTEPAPGRYAYHDLLRSYATELLEEGDPADRQEATGRLLDHYVHTARAAFRLSGRAAVADPDAARSGVTIERPADLSAHLTPRSPTTSAPWRCSARMTTGSA